MYKYERKNNVIKPYAVNYQALYGSNSVCANSDENYSRGENGSHYVKVFSNSNSKSMLSSIIRFISACIFLIISSVAFVIGTGKIENYENKYAQYQYYDSIILPIVMQNPEPFDEKNLPKPKMVLDSAVWDAAMNTKDCAALSDDYGRTVISAQEVLNSVQKLFGNSVEIDLKSSLKGDFYEFDSNENKFTVDCISGTDNYIPRTVNYYNDGEDIILKVGYIRPSDRFKRDMKDVEDGKIEKYARYRLRKGLDNNYFVASIK